MELAIVARSEPENQEVRVIIVGGQFKVDPAQREAFLRERHELMRTSRGEDGCLEYTYAADPLEPDRVILFERWESQEALDAHLAALAVTTTVASRSAEVKAYDVAAERSLR
jgi:quinol monooxygenase YgiN